jgi:long-chain acyl-CoA synthetase
MQTPWLSQYPDGVPETIDPNLYASVVDMLEQSFKKHAARDAFLFLGQRFSYADFDRQSRALAGFFHANRLRKGDRVAVMLPNMPQYAITVAAILRAGLIVVNVNPLYTARELQHQLNDSGAKAIVILENFGAVLQACQAKVPTRHVIIAAMGDCLGFIKGTVVNQVLRHVKKLVPSFKLQGDVVRFNEALRLGKGVTWPPVALESTDVAVLQYTGGTTGLSKGATLSHRNIVANTLQSAAWYIPALRKIPADVQVTAVCALPLYHIFSFTVNLMLTVHQGGCLILIPNPRDLPMLFKALRGQRFHTFPAVSTLFNAVLRHPQVHTVDWSHLVLSVGGGMAVQQAVAKQWLEKIGCPICEGYGLSEASPCVTCNPTDSTTFNGTIGLPLPGTDILILDDEGQEMPPGQPGELCVRGPQVMAGYWRQPRETIKVMTNEGFLRTGDIATLDENGYVKIVDRKKDLILVSGFNVYPNEVEDVLMQLDGILECAVIGLPDEHTGEAVKAFIVLSELGTGDSRALTEQTIRQHCETHLTGYKRPRYIEFRKELPKTPVGKVLRRELRPQTSVKASTS